MIDLKRWLRSPRTITAELLAVTVLGGVATALPEAGDPEAWSAFARSAGALAALPRLLGFDRVTGSWLFIAALLVATGSLGIVLVEQLDRARRALRGDLDVRWFQGAPLRAEFVRPARPGAATTFQTRRRLGSLGSPVFHTGLLVVAGAGLIRALFAADAQVDLLVGETLAPSAEAWGAQWGGPLAPPIALEEPVTLREVVPQHYPSGELRGLAAVVEVRGREALLERSVGVNSPMALPGGTLYVGSLHGPAALLEIARDGGAPPLRQAVMLQPVGGTRYEERLITSDDALLVQLRATGQEGGAPPSAEVRVLLGPREVYRGPMAVGEQLGVPGYGAVTLRGWTSWVRLSGTRDASIPIAYAGLFAVVTGALLLFGAIRVDTVVQVESDGTTDRVVVALRAERLAPLFREQFDALVAREGGGSS